MYTKTVKNELKIGCILKIIIKKDIKNFIFYGFYVQVYSKTVKNEVKHCPERTNIV